MIPGEFSWFFTVPGRFLLIPGGFLWLFSVPGLFFLIPGFVLRFSWFRVGLYPS